VKYSTLKVIVEKHQHPTHQLTILTTTETARALTTIKTTAKTTAVLHLLAETLREEERR
jgi:hypothetical protein